MVKYLTTSYGNQIFHSGTNTDAGYGIVAMCPKNIEGSNVYHVDLVYRGKWLG